RFDFEYIARRGFVDEVSRRWRNTEYRVDPGLLPPPTEKRHLGWRTLMRIHGDLLDFSSSSFGIDGLIGQLGQRLVGLFLLGQSLIEQFDGILHAEFCGPGLERSVAGDLVVLDGLRRRHAAGVKRGVAPV